MADGSTQLTPAQAAGLLIRRREARDSLVAYAQTIDIPGAPVTDDDDEGRFLPVETSMAKHHELLCAELQRCMTTRYGRLMVFMPPGAAKSTYCSVIAPTWYMGNRPGARIILAMHNGEIAKKQGKKARAIVRQPAYKATFQAELSKETSAGDMWATTTASEYMAAGILGGITGNRANGMIIDDPIKGRRDADSPAVRKSTLEAYQDDLISRMLPGGWMVLVQTRWHESDLAGALLPDGYAGQSGDILCKDGMVWRVLNVPAEAYLADDPLNRAPGEMLWPEWFDPQHWVAPRKNKRTWSALYQQSPTSDEGTTFKREWFKWYDKHTEKPPYLNRFVASDYATTDENDANDPDFTEHGCAGIAPDGGLYLLDWFYAQCETDVGIDALLNMARRNKTRRGFGEVGVIRRAIEPAFKRRKKELKIPLDVVYLPHIGNKAIAALSFQSLASSGQVYLPKDTPWAERLVDQLCGFPAAAHDDGVDVCSLFGRAIDQMAYGREPEPEEEDQSLKPFSWRWLVHGTEDNGPSKPKTM